MLFKTLGDKSAPAVLFFLAMGVTGESSGPVASALAGRFFCVMPTSTVYCAGQTYADKADEVRQIKEFLRGQGVERVEMVVASSIGADLAMAFLTQTQIPVGHVFFVAAGKALSYGNIRRQMADSLEDKPFPPLSKGLQKHCFFEFGSAEDHFKYRAAVMQAYPAGNFPVFDRYNHMQYQIRDPKGFAAMMELPFLQKE